MNTPNPSTLRFFLVICLNLAGIARSGEMPTPALGGLDPVLLTQGLEVKGKAGTEITCGRYQYLFADSESRRKFEAAPDQYGIQFDGFCMNMGPLSGRGSPERWYVSDGRIYLFASDSCRETFKLDPAAYTDRADLPPVGNTASRARGRELIMLALTGFGGVDKVDAINNVRWCTETVYEQDGKQTKLRQVATLVMPDKLRLDYAYGDFQETHELAGGRLVEVRANSDITHLPADVYEFVRRRLYREPLALLRARNEPGFVAVAGGKGEIAGESVEWLNVGYAGATTKLGIDPKTGRILGTVYRGRAPSALGEICRTYSNFEPVEGGLTLPLHWDVTYAGLPAPGPKPASRAVSVNVPNESR